MIKNNKGFSAVKLLAIISLIGIIVFLVIPKGISYYNNIRKEKYIEVANKYIESVRKDITNRNFIQMPKENEALLVPLSNTKVKTKSPFGAFKDKYSYVIVTYDGLQYDYYFASIDSSKYGVPLVNKNSLKKDVVTYGLSNLHMILDFSELTTIYVNSTIYEISEKDKIEDKNILLKAVSGELSVSYDFKEDTYIAYDKLIKNIDLDEYNREATINNGVLKYKDTVISKEFSKDLYGLFRYLSFPNEIIGGTHYYYSFITYNNSYAAGMIEKHGNYNNEHIEFASMPKIILYPEGELVRVNGNKMMMWNAMAIYPNNNNYKMLECGIIAIKNNTGKPMSFDIGTPGVIVAKSKNNCARGNIFAVRKKDIVTGEKWMVLGYLIYENVNGHEHVVYSGEPIVTTIP